MLVSVPCPDNTLFHKAADYVRFVSELMNRNGLRYVRSPKNL